MSQPLPYSRGCFICGDDNPKGLRLKFRREADGVEVEFTPHEDYSGFPGMTHGGVSTALLDEAMSWAVVTHSRRFCHTAELKVRFRRPTPAGETLRITARETGGRGRLRLASGEIHDAEGQALVEAEGKFLLLDEEVSRRIDEQLIHTPGSWRLFEND